jgi:hypothetical protein
MIFFLCQMYNQSGMGGDAIRPPVSLANLPNLPNLPLPPDLSRLHQEKALNLQVFVPDFFIFVTYAIANISVTPLKIVK